MLGTSTLAVSSGNGGTSVHEDGRGGGEAAHQTSIMTGFGDDDQTQSGSDGGGGGGDLFEGERSSGGNRWPRQETLALLKIRSDMDAIFRDSSLKGPLWEEISRKMGKLGYHRSAKKCKEKFENVYKYHKRTKDGRVGKSDGKTYRFFDQLEALEQHHFSITTTTSLPPLPQPSAQVTPRGQSQAPPPESPVPVTMVIPAGINPAGVTISSNSPHPVSVVHTSPIISTTQQINVNPTNPVVHFQSPQPQPQHHQVTMTGIPTHSSIQMENVSSPSATQSSSSTSSDEELLGRRTRKRRWKDYFEKMMQELIVKQEELQKRFLEAVEKREQERVAREDAWRMQEIERLNREHDIRVQERSVAAARDAALIDFLRKLSDHTQISLPLPVQAQVSDPATATGVANITPATPQPQTQAQKPEQVLQPQPHPQPQRPINVVADPIALPTQPQPQPQRQPQPVTPFTLQTPPHLQKAVVAANTNNGDNVDLEKANSGDNLLQASSSRWPKAEIEALINLRTSLDQKYHENGPKGPLWEEISALMKKIGYNRNAKRCKEKWENINKYYKKVKESNKRRPEDSKTCPYFHQLDALYSKKSKTEVTNLSFSNPATNAGSISTYGPPQVIKHEDASIAQQEQQWPTIHMHPGQTMEDQGSDNVDESEDDGDGDEDDDEQGNGYEIVANNNNNGSE